MLKPMQYKIFLHFQFLAYVFDWAKYTEKEKYPEVTDPSLEIFQQDIGLHNPKVLQWFYILTGLYLWQLPAPLKHSTLHMQNNKGKYKFICV